MQFCNVCQSKFQNMAQFRRHTLKNHLDLQCEQCEKKLSTKFAMGRHMKIHQKKDKDPLHSTNDEEQDMFDDSFINLEDDWETYALPVNTNK